MSISEQKFQTTEVTRNLRAFFFFSLTVLPLASVPAQAFAASTATTLTMTSASKIVAPGATIASGSEVTLSAKVVAGATTVLTGQVNFCDASAKSCSDIHLLATAEITNAGTATLKFHPAIGNRSYKAVFLGTKTESASSSTVSNLTVSGKYPTAAAIVQTGAIGNYTLTATVSSAALAGPGPTGKVSFLDSNNANALLGSASLGAAVNAPTLLNVSNPPVGNNPGGIVTGDFNGDGFLDLAVGLNQAAKSVAILLGDGAGNFTPVTKNPIAVAGTPVAVQDFNRDGIPDLLLSDTSNGPGSFTILLGNGDGAFSVANGSPIFTNYGVSPVVVADFNGDGIPDIASAGGYYLIVLLGDGHGGFMALPPSSSLPGADEFGSMAVGDINGDGIPDLVTLSSIGGSIATYIGNGDGTFKPSTTITIGPVTGGSTTSLVLGDFNGDGKLDIAAPEYGGSSTISMELGNGDGTFHAAPNSPFAAPDWTTQVFVGDFNGDSVADLLAVAQTSGQTLAIYLGKGNGTFEAANYGSAGIPCCGASPALGDFNNDGFTDLASASFYDGTAEVLISQSTVATATVTGIAPAGPGTHLAVASYPGNANYAASISATTPLSVQVAAPVLSLAPGTYTTAQKIAITDATPKATIFYQVFNYAGGPSTSGYVAYTGPVSISGNGQESISAYATATGYQQSTTVYANYTLSPPPAAAPVISVPSGTYAAAQTVSLTDSTPGAKIYYVTDGTYPNTGSTLYTAPVKISASETLEAIAIAPGYSQSDDAFAQYLIGSAPVSLFYTAAGDGIPGYSGDGGAATSADLDFPDGTAVDSAGNLYIVDDQNNRIRKVTVATGVITTVAGNGIAGYSGDGKSATAAELSSPTGLAVDTAGNLYIVDDGNNAIRKVTASTGIITTLAGNGNCGFSGDGGPAAKAELCYPTTIAVDSAGDLFIADWGNDRIRKIAAKTGIISTYAGNGGSGTGGNGGPAVNAELGFPRGVAVDSSGNLYIADTRNSEIRKVNAAQIISLVAGTGTPGSTGDGGKATSAELGYPTAVAVDGAGNFYVTDQSYKAVRKVTVASGMINTVVGSKNGYGCDGLAGNTATSDNLCYPSSVSVNNTGNLYIAEPNQNQVVQATATAAPPAAVTATPTFSIAAGTYASPQTLTISDATPGAAIYVTRDGAPPTVQYPAYNGPIDISGAVTVQAIAVAPGHRVSAPVKAAYSITAAPTATISTFAGVGLNGILGAGGPASSAQIGYSTGIAFDAAGNLYLAETTNNVVSMISAKTGFISTVAGNFTPGYSGDGGPATSAQLNSPNGVAVDSAGNIYISDSENVVVRKVDAATGQISTFAGVFENTGYSGDLGNGGPATSALLNYPLGLAIDSEGNLYIADNGDAEVRKVDAKTGIITAFAGTGYPGYSGDGGFATGTKLEYPIALAFGSNGDLFIADNGESRIRKVSAKTGIISTVAGNGDYGYSGDGLLAKDAQIAPQGLAVDPAGNLYISNWPGAVREISAATSTISTIAGNSSSNLLGDGGSATMALLDDPQGVALDASGNLYIADYGDFRIRKVTFSGPTPTPVFSLAPGAYDGTQTISLLDAVPDAAIYYTTNGAAPTTASARYTDPIAVSATEKLEAIAVAAGRAQSPAASAQYTIVPLAATPTFSLKAGSYAAYEYVKIADTTPGATIYYTTNGTTPTTASTKYTAEIAVQTSETVSAIAVAPGFAASAVASAAYTITLPTAIPVFSPAAGTYASAQSVHIYDGDPGSAIYYTTNGDTPTTASAKYASAISVASSETLKAIAIAPGRSPSGVASAAYVIP